MQTRFARMKKGGLMAVLFFALMFVLAACGGQSGAVLDYNVGDENASPQNTQIDTSNMPLINADNSVNVENLDGRDDDPKSTLGPKMSHAEDYERYRQMNSDTVGWLSVPNTNVEYPIMHKYTGPGNTDADNEYYLVRNPEQQSSKSGSVFLDARNTDPQNDRHAILYGHNMRSGSMFSGLQNYKREDFFKNNRDITVVFGDTSYHYEVYAAGVVNTDTPFIDTSFSSDEVFLAYFNRLRGLSKYSPTPSVTLTAQDHILTMVTCTYEYDNSRFIVQARRVDY